MRISYIMSVLKTLIDLCAIRQKINIKIPFASIVYNVLVIKILGTRLRNLFENKRLADCKIKK